MHGIVGIIGTALCQRNIFKGVKAKWLVGKGKSGFGFVCFMQLKRAKEKWGLAPSFSNATKALGIRHKHHVSNYSYYYMSQYQEF